MFGFFKKNKQKQAVKTTVTSPSQEIKNPTPEQIHASILKLESELGALKSAYTEVTGKELPKATAPVRVDPLENVIKSGKEKIIEGVFDGQNMISADGEQYDVPANYASKSKLVEGDILKLTINNMGAFVYKQIKPIERERLVGVLDQDEQNLQYYATLDGKKWRLLTASVTYFKGEPGDEVVFIIPQENGSTWAAVENIVKE